MDSEEKNSEENKRRNFLKNIFSFAATVGLISSVKANTIIEKPEKIKMLTPDGRLVEIEKSKIEKEIISERASNVEVHEWMNSKNDT